MTLLAIICAFLAAATSHAHSKYVKLNPNGANVPGVDAIGHTDPNGGGARNAYGEDFKSAGLKWTVALCQADSDSDNQTNGFELGDPCCTWAEGGPAPLFTVNISHPGLNTSRSSRAPYPC